MDIIHGAYIEATSFVFGAGLSGEEDDRDFVCGGISLEAGTDFVAVHAGHHDVEENEIGLLFGRGESESFFAVGGDLGFVTVLESSGDHADVEGRVVDDKD